MIPKHVFMIMTSLFLDTKPKADDGQRSQGGALNRRDAVRRRRRHTTICYYMELQGGSTNLIILEAKGRCTAAAASQDFQSWAASSSTQRIELL